MRYGLIAILTTVALSLGCASKQPKPTALAKPQFTPMDSNHDLVRKAVERDDTKTARNWLFDAAAKNGVTVRGL